MGIMTEPAYSVETLRATTFGPEGRDVQEEPNHRPKKSQTMCSDLPELRPLTVPSIGQLIRKSSPHFFSLAGYHISSPISHL